MSILVNMFRGGRKNYEHQIPPIHHRHASSWKGSRHRLD